MESNGEKNIVTVDFSKCRYIHEVHRLMKEKLGFPDFYGENLDALWDCLTGFYVPEHIMLKGLNQLRFDESWSKTIDQIIEIFKEAQDEYGDIQVEFVD